MARVRRRRLTRPARTTWVIALILAIVAVLAYLGVLRMPELRAYAFWIMAAAFGVLALGNLAEGV